MKITALSAIALGFIAVNACALSQAQTPSTQTTIEALERQSWAAWQSHDGAFWEHFLSDDHVEVHPTGRATKAEIVGFITSGACTVASYALSDMRFVQFSPDSALLSYRAEQNTTCGASHPDSPVWITSTYVFRDGRWQNSGFIETPIPAAAH
jgi:hypothetical protein